MPYAPGSNRKYEWMNALIRDKLNYLSYKKVLMVHDSVLKKKPTYIKYSQYGALTLIQLNSLLQGQ
jgi:hypothetical protein